MFNNVLRFLSKSYMYSAHIKDNTIVTHYIVNKVIPL